MIKVNDAIPVYFDHESKTEALDFIQSKALDYVIAHKSGHQLVEFAVRDNAQQTAIIRGAYGKREYGEVSVSIYEFK